jgi:O-acetyl-ADP-ribose deacetylase (regulator of RNase III)
MVNMMPAVFWTNPSVLELSRDREPVEAITTEARDVVFHALEHGWQGPPFDPFALAEFLAIETQPTSEVMDARTVPLGGNRFRIDFNPDRPHRRMRYSIFHEIAHTLFPDCAQMIRNRGEHRGERRDEWQLETLCNIAAAEFLLPTGALGEVTNLRPSVDTILDLRERYEASAEAALLRIRRLTGEPAMAFACHRDRTSGRYTIEYALPTASANWSLRPGKILPVQTAAADCTAIGYTAKRAENWPQFGNVLVECVGVAPFPREIFPRVIGFVRPLKPAPVDEKPITYIRGDATLPRAFGMRLVIQVVNDAALTWGGTGFAIAVKRQWPAAQRAFTTQVSTDRTALKLGNILVTDVGPQLKLVNLVAQHGYGASPRPRIRYGALRDSLLRVSEMAQALGASVHMPRIGTGQAGGAWPIVEEIIRETLTRRNIEVFVYDLPQGKEKPKPQGDLPFTS